MPIPNNQPKKLKLTPQSRLLSQMHQPRKLKLTPQ